MRSEKIEEPVHDAIRVPGNVGSWLRTEVEGLFNLALFVNGYIQRHRA